MERYEVCLTRSVVIYSVTSVTSRLISGSSFPLMPLAMQNVTY